MTCAQCRLACFLAGCGEGDSHGGGGGMWGGGVNSPIIFVRGVPLNL